MFTKSKNDGRLAELESAVADAARDVAQARQAHRGSCQALADARASLAESPNSDALSNVVSQAFDEAGQRSSELGSAMERLADAERQLTITREAPQRTELAKTLQSRRRRLTVLKNELVPLLREFEAEILETHHNNLQFSLPGAGRQMQQELFERLTWLVEHLGDPGGLDVFLRHLDTYAAEILDGSQPASLGANHLLDQRLAKAS